MIKNFLIKIYFILLSNKVLKPILILISGHHVIIKFFFALNLNLINFMVNAINFNYIIIKNFGKFIVQIIINLEIFNFKEIRQYFNLSHQHSIIK